ncbi:hypothetical protein A3C09_02755 [Candidatus Uhrbacteria bacterium RIFCSPHIGHO2_02_FULL_47_44]|uniref:Sporulation stage II protein D amidase enhancer LytB N-terminal domain-containing protein n=1 Tax=Candidatus Uhrbacteria bacterium RIFCSPLOWO2_02_FULL_48_18 TaxID=1802408 RepID=A0A1F7V6Y0_9BACT|nr:MAG: hypothetical protein A3C09_02755 [Candidatus Uhrbacteria bacterium RIFCSPHIGHO2_02_FULL_47_44]OGL77239.1 MAG: hypothetical protein A3E97_01050 [Candidatus Uhrbacteria bacterium RIFCSPHIGHO2_12_FULL_47_12]OGL80466.1 MAG: hypothetical protein A3B20_03600 [Candidatus Uhrbacteria bacterium RIFCSPLOWO2_01_FULL_47_17]OGL86326.1 MAG: hypothetical protein A3I41_02080 [Candidatus Uhrbacteria bacterium RIFCSPLOWO2_02_FULL_48_18]OGL93044.1 MAG: hypothetical protein A3H12_01275 [Candidatus Uhrbacte
MKRFLHQNAALPLGRQVGKKIALFGLVFFFAVTSIPFANAAPRKGYEAKVVTAPIETIIMAPGETKTISLTYKNSGKTAWKRKGAGYVSFYTADKNYRKSVFEAKNWFDATHAALLKETTVKPGASGNFKLVLKAPEKVGTYKEAFGMVAEDITWIPGGELKLVIEVQKPGTVAKAKPASAPSVKLVSDTSAPTLSAFLLLRSTKLVTAEGNEQIVYKVGMKNTGTTPWMKREVRSSDALAIASVGALPTTQIALNTSGVVEPGALDFLSFVFKAPPTKGMYTIKYQFAANDVVLSDAEILIPVEVTSDAEDVLNSPVLDATILQNMIPEPMLRIGVLIVDEETNNEVKISCNTDWKLVDGNGALLAEQAANQSINAFYKNSRYYFNRGQGLEQSSFFLRFVPNTEGAVCKIENFDKRVTRRAGYAENTFRNILELRYNSKKDRTWVINEVKMEEYLAGLGETSELSDHEFKKTLITIARTYALYHFERATKHANEFFHMNSSADDQVYRGYEYEVNNPSIRLSAQETRGVTVTYEGRTAITPYFSRSDGRTRDWGEVWHGTVAWIKSVPTPCDAANGRKLWGHGVGLSASEALCMAKSGRKWDDILKYFYQGIDLTKRWM